MRRVSVVTALAIGLTLVLSGGAFAKSSCKDASGKFIKCPTDTAAAAPAATTTPAKPAKAAKCKDASGKFTKCPAAGAAPAAAPAAPAKAAPAKPAAKEAKPAAAAAAPAAASSAGAPAGATAKCKDGSYSKSKTHSGSCSHHGGVATFL